MGREREGEAAISGGSRGIGRRGRASNRADLDMLSTIHSDAPRNHFIDLSPWARSRDTLAICQSGRHLEAMTIPITRANAVLEAGHLVAVAGATRSRG